MASMRRRRVMLDSDDEGQNEEKQGEAPLVTPSPIPPKKKRRLAVAEVEEDESGLDGVEALREPDEEEKLEGEREEEEMERKRRQQLAARWSKLGEDSDHGNSEGSESEEEGDRVPRRSSVLVQLRVQDAWRRRPSKKASRLLPTDANRSGDDDDDDMNEMDDFIVNEPDDDAETPFTRKKSDRRGNRDRIDATPVSETRKSPRNVLQGGARGKVTSLSRRNTQSTAEKESSSRTKQSAKKGAKSAAEGAEKRENTVAVVDSSSDEESPSSESGADEENISGVVNGGGNAKGRARVQNGDSRSEHSDSDDSCIPSNTVATRSGRRTKMRKDKASADELPKEAISAKPSGRSASSRKNRKSAVGSGSGEASSSEPAASASINGARSSDRQLRAQKRKDSAAAKSREALSCNTPPIDLSSDIDDRAENRGDGTNEQVGNEDEEHDNVNETPKGRGTAGHRTAQTTKPSKASKKKAALESDNDEEAVSTTKARSTSSRRQRKARVNYREMIMGSSSDRGRRKHKTRNQVGQKTPGDNVGLGAGNNSSESSEGDEDESNGEHEEGAGQERRNNKCGKDQDADEDESFAVNLSDDDFEDDSEFGDEEEEEEVEERRRNRSKKASEGGKGTDKKRTRQAKAAEIDGRRRSTRGKNKAPAEEQEESAESEDIDDFLADDDEESEDGDEDGDVFFSHAALFHEQEQSQEGGISSLSVEPLTLHEAFLHYVEYIAKATAGNGEGAAFMKKYVSQPRLPEHARYGKAKEIVEKKVCITRESLCGTWRQDFRDSILRYPHYGYQHVDMMETVAHCDACNRSNVTKVVAFLSGTEYDPARVWDGLRWDRYLPEHWDDPVAMATSKQKSHATHHLGDTCMHKSHLYHSLVHYKLYLVSKVAAKVRADGSLEPENFRGEGSSRMSAKKKKKCLNFTENEFESLSGLLDKADELNGVKWGSKAGVRGGRGKTFLETGAGSSILEWLSGEAQPGQYGELDLGGRQSDDDNDEEAEDAEEEFSVGRGRRWQTVGSRGGRYG